MKKEDAEALGRARHSSFLSGQGVRFVEILGEAESAANLLIRLWRYKWGKQILFFAVAIVAGVIFMISVMIARGSYADYGGNPDWQRKIEGREEVYYASLSLKNASIRVYVQLILEYEGEIFYIVKVDKFFVENFDDLSNHGNGDDFLRLTIGEGQEERLDALLGAVQEGLLAKLEREGHGDKKSFRIYEAREAEIVFQNKKRYGSKKAYWIFTEGESRELSEMEKGQRKVCAEWDLDSCAAAQMSAGHEGIEKIVDDCFDILTKRW